MGSNKSLQTLDLLYTYATVWRGWGRGGEWQGNPGISLIQEFKYFHAQVLNT